MRFAASTLDNIPWSAYKPRAEGIFLFLPDKEQNDDPNFPYAHFVCITSYKGFLVADSDTWETWMALDSVESGFWCELFPENSRSQQHGK